MYACNHCHKEVQDNLITIKDLQVSVLTAILTKSKTEKTWVCINCDFLNILSETEPIHERMPDKPYYLKVVWDHPVKQFGLQGHNTFDNEFSNWFWYFMKELEYQLGLYRIEYRNQHDQEMEGGEDYKDDGKD